VVFCDKRNHASLIDGCRFARAGGATVRFYHTLEKLRAMLEKLPAAARRLIVTDAVFSMDGDLADLPQLAEMAETFDAVLILDDAHGTGVLGPNGHGTVQHYGLSGQGDRFIHLGTLSKAIGAQGGFVAGNREVIDWLINAARPLIYSTGLNPAACGAALAAFEVLQSEPQRLSRLREVTQRLAGGLQNLGFEARLQPSPIIPVMIGEAREAVALSESLLAQGVWCPAIRPPTVPPGTSRLRVTASATLSDANIDRALAAFAAAQR
jgi:7-keto-8-aminopelargonate synthetase-like enzyme